MGCGNTGVKEEKISKKVNEEQESKENNIYHS